MLLTSSSSATIRPAFAIERFRVVEGEPLGKARRSAGGAREIILGKQAAEAMKMKVGDLIRLTGGTFKVVGVYNSGDGFEDAASIVSLQDAQQLLQKHRQVGAVQVKVKDPREIQAIRARLEKQFPRLSVSQSGDVADQSQMVAYTQGFAVAIALLAVVIGGVGMTNTVMMSTFERTREIGTLRAVGWRRRQVMAMIFGESLLLGVIGGLIGCAIGAGLVAWISASTAIGYLQGTVTPSLIAMGLITAIGLGAVGGFIPRARVQNAADRGAAVSGRRGPGIEQTAGPREVGDDPIVGAATRTHGLDDHGHQHRAGLDRDAEQHDRRYDNGLQPNAGRHRCRSGGAAEGCQRHGLQRDQRKDRAAGGEYPWRGEHIGHRHQRSERGKPAVFPVVWLCAA